MKPVTTLLLLAALLSNPWVFSQSVQSFVLVNAETDTDIMTLTNGQSIDLNMLPTTNLNIAVITNPDKVSFVEFQVNGIAAGSDKATPYAIFGDRRGNYDAWTPAVGNYSFTATPFTTSKGKTNAGTGATISISFIRTTTGTAPVAPANLQATVSTQGIAQLQWTDQSDNEDAFAIEYATTLSPTPNWAALNSTPANALSYTDNGLANNGLRHYRVRAANAFGQSAYSNTATAYNLPLTPTGLAGNGANTNSLSLVWNAVSYADNYQLEYALSGTGTYLPGPTVAFGNNTTTINGLTESTTYDVRIRTSFAGSSSAWSSPIQLNTSTAQQEVVALVLINADTDTDIGPLADGDTLNLFYLPTSNLNIRAETNPSAVGSVGFAYDGNANFQTENAAPYALAGNTGSDYNAWTPSLGNHTLTATPYSGSAKSGTAGIALSVGFVVINKDTSTVVVTPPLISGELKQWHKVTLSFEGPQTSETDAVNPFTNYRLDVTFTNGSRSYTVPGYYAADGNAAETGATSGNIWQVHFSPDATGVWQYTASFKAGANIATAASAAPGTPVAFDGQSGSFTIAASDKTGRDHRGKGRLQYVGQHYLQFAGTGEYFVKAGADAPENTLAYNDFDATSNRKSLRKTWSFHQQDYNAADASSYTWQGGKGSELLGAVSYLSNQGMNAFSFLTFSFAGDDQNVFPHLLKISVAEYEALPAIAGDAATQTAIRQQHWTDAVHHDRFDVSKMAQWEKIFSYADQMGMYLHFKTMETENDNLMDNNAMGNERKIYYRELIARYGHHLALNWNITEEESLSTQVIKDIATYIAAVDAYDHNIVIHTFPGGLAQYGELTGNLSALTGASMQIDINNVHNNIGTWVNNSAAAGKKWVVANDEQGGANAGVSVDAAYPTAQLPDSRGVADNRDAVRKNVLWGTLMAGGAGVEYYYGYQTGSSDLTSQDHRTRATKWQDAKLALDFFTSYTQPYITQWTGNDALTTNTSDYVLQVPDQWYAVYLPNGGSTDIDLSAANGTFSVQWYDTRNGGVLQNGSVTSVSGGALANLGNAPDNTSLDWLVVIEKATAPASNRIVEGKQKIADTNVALSFAAYPNPSKGNLWLTTNNQLSKQAQYTLTNSDGRRVKTLRANGGITNMNVAGLTPGFYLITLSDGQTLHSEKIAVMQ